MQTASTPASGRSDTPGWEVIGWVTLASLVLGGAVLLGLLAAAARLAGRPAMTDTLVFFLLFAGGVGAFYLLAVDLPLRRQRRAIWSGGALARVAPDLQAVFAELGAGDLVRAEALAGTLPAAIAERLRAACAALAALAQQVQTSSISAASAAEAVEQIASDLAAGSSQQAASVVEITAAMEQLAHTAADIAENASRQAGLAAHAESSGVGGAAAVEQAVAGVEAVRLRISGIANRADTLGTRSKEIWSALDLIAEIAHETHVLSLNAAIAAAAAGDRGRRFAVIAEEVRRLAQRSRDSVGSVRTLLDEFGGSIRTTVVATEEGGKEANRVLERARSAATAIGDLRDAAGSAALVAREISLATRQQNAASDEVVLTLRELNQVVQRMTRELQTLTETARALNRVGLDIQLLTQSFHLDSPRSLRHLAEDWAERAARAAGDTEIEVLLGTLVEKNPFVELAYFARRDGRVSALGVSAAQARSGNELAARLRDADLRERPWFRAVAREWRTTVTPPYESLPGGQNCFTVVAPVRRAAAGASATAPASDRDVVGILGMDVSVGAWTHI